MALGLVVAKQGRSLESYKNKPSSCQPLIRGKQTFASPFSQASPEYPQSPAAHRNSPTTINTSGSTSHWDKDVRAGHRKAAKGNDGVRTRASDRTRTGLSMSLSDFLGFRRGLCGAGLEDDIVTAWDEGCGSQCCFLLVMLADGDGHLELRRQSGHLHIGKLQWSSREPSCQTYSANGAVTA